MTLIITTNVYGHGIGMWYQKGEMVVRIVDYGINRQTLPVGSELDIQGRLVGIAEESTIKSISVLIETDNMCGQFAHILNEPATPIKIKQGEEIPFRMKIVPTHHGVFHIHPMIDIDGLGESTIEGYTIIVLTNEEKIEGTPIHCHREYLPYLVGSTIASIFLTFVIFVIIKQKKQNIT